MAWASGNSQASLNSLYHPLLHSFLLFDWALLLQPKEQSPKQQSPQQNGAKLSSRATSRTFSGLMADVPACLSFSDLSNSYPADFKSEYGPNHPSRELVRTARRVVVKVWLFGICCVKSVQQLLKLLADAPFCFCSFVVLLVSISFMLFARWV